MNACQTQIAQETHFIPVKTGTFAATAHALYVMGIQTATLMQIYHTATPPARHAMNAPSRHTVQVVCAWTTHALTVTHLLRMQMAQIQPAHYNLEGKKITVFQDSVFNAKKMAIAPALLRFAQRLQFLGQLSKPTRAWDANQIWTVKRQTLPSQFAIQLLRHRQSAFLVCKILIAVILKSVSTTSVDAETTLIAQSQQEFVLQTILAFLGVKRINSVHWNIQEHQAVTLGFLSVSMVSAKSAEVTENVQTIPVAPIIAVFSVLTAQIAALLPTDTQQTASTEFAKNASQPQLTRRTVQGIARLAREKSLFAKQLQSQELPLFRMSIPA
jgi:hypothetical protein